MTSRPRPRLAAIFILAALPAVIGGCVQPLGPRFSVVNRKTEITSTGGAPSGLHLRVSEVLENTGDRALDSLEVRLPAVAAGPNAFRVKIDQQELRFEAQPDQAMAVQRAAFHPAWEQGQQREVTLEGDLGAPRNAAGRPLGFYLTGPTVVPAWRAPDGLFGGTDLRPKNETLAITVPADFRVQGSGRPTQRRSETSVEYTFRGSPDAISYVLAGAYQEKIISTSNGRVNFWTFQPLDEGVAQQAAQRLAASMRALSDYFGKPLPTAANSEFAVRIAELPDEFPGELPDKKPGEVPGEAPTYRAASLPGGALLDARAIAAGISSARVLALAESQLAQSWFGWEVQPALKQQILMSRGVGLFGLVIVAASRGRQDRAAAVATLLAQYDSARKIAHDRALPETPAGYSPAGYSPAERTATAYRAALFYVALEDLCGSENLRSALRRIVSALNGQTASDADLRSAVEAASQRDLADVFRAWLNRPEIPQDFRARYAPAAAAE